MYLLTLIVTETIKEAVWPMAAVWVCPRSIRHPPEELVPEESYCLKSCWSFMCTHRASTVQMSSKDSILSLVAPGQKQQGSQSAAIGESKLSSNMGTDVSQSSRIRQIISVAYVFG